MTKIHGLTLACSAFLLVAACGDATDKSAAEEQAAAPAATEAADSTVSAGGSASTLEGDVSRKSYALGMQFGARFKESSEEVSIERMRAGIEGGFRGDEFVLEEVPEGAERKSADFGNRLGDTLRRSGEEFDVAALGQAIDDVYNDGQVQLSVAEAADILVAADTELRERRAKEALDRSEAYLRDNATRENVKSTDSGLQYEVITEGSGATPGPDDEVKVHYRGRLIDGTEFDSSYERGTPAEFPLSRVIDGWTEGLQLMAVGSTYRFFIPPALGYGEQGAGDAIGPNEALIFEVELLGIN